MFDITCVFFRELGRKEKEELEKIAEIAKEGFMFKKQLIQEAKQGLEDKKVWREKEALNLVCARLILYILLNNFMDWFHVIHATFVQTIEYRTNMEFGKVYLSFLILFSFFVCFVFTSSALTVMNPGLVEKCFLKM